MAEPLGFWVYGVVRADTPDLPRRSGVDGRHDAELIRHAGLAAVVSAVGLDEFNRELLEPRLEALERLEAIARAHEQVLDDALRLGPVLPMPICTIYEDANHVREMLERERQPLRVALERLRGTSEWGVKAYVVPSEAGSANGRRPRPSSGTAYLARKQVQRVAALRGSEDGGDAVEYIHRALSEHALAAVVSPPHDKRLSGTAQEMVLNVAYLVPDAHLAEFRARMDDLASSHASDGLALALTGPWPPYHFASSAAAR